MNTYSTFQNETVTLEINKLYEGFDILKVTLTDLQPIGVTVMSAEQETVFYPWHRVQKITLFKK